MNIIDKFEETAICVGFAGIVLINLGNVFSRYVIHMSWSFSEEIMIMLFVYITVLGISQAFKKGSHMAFTVLTDFLPKKTKKIFIIVINLAIIFMMLLLLKNGIKMVVNEIIFKQTTPALGLPAWVQSGAIPLGAIMVIIRVIQSAKRELFS
jgi:TRAP-type C4-dicarboxylate transport system permease small subunit